MSCANGLLHGYFFFNLKKCKVMHLGITSTNLCWEYKMTDKCGKVVTIYKVEREQNLGIIFQNNLKFNEHINMAANKTNKITGLIKGSFSFLDKPTFLTLYQSLIHSHMDYGNSILFPALKKDLRIIENTQRRATKLLADLYFILRTKT